MTFDELAALCAADGLAIVGAFHPDTNDKAPIGCQTLVMLGPDEPGFWQRITSCPEYSAANPIDRWSERVIGRLATKVSATALFPFGGPAYQPFISWALRTGQIWSSPVSLLVHDSAGLFVSFRGALAFMQKIDLPEKTKPSPCESCVEKPCLTACPVAALGPQGYDVVACHGYLDGAGKETCLSSGCLARCSCPISKNYGRLAEQSAHHMRAFQKG